MWLFLEQRSRMLFLVVILFSCTLSLVDGSQDQYSSTENGYKIVCYFASWAYGRQGIGKFDVENIDPQLCTHVVYAFAYISGHELVPTAQNSGIRAEGSVYGRFNQLKTINPTLKTMLAIGGANMEGGLFRYVAATDESRTLFSENVVTYLRDNGFDGVDVDWEFPEPEDRDIFTELLKTLKQTFADESTRTQKPPLLLSAALGVNEPLINTVYNIPDIAQYIDFANIMTYDLYGPWTGYTGIHSALYMINTFDKLTQEWIVNEYLKHNMPAEKIMLGIPTYGRSFTLTDPNSHDISDKITGGGRPGLYTQETGILSYYEICLHTDFHHEYSSEQDAAYAYAENQWVGFDNTDSIVKKAAFVQNYNLGGVMFWDLSLDEFNNQCGGGNFTLINTAKNILQGTASGSSPVLQSTHTNLPWMFLISELMGSATILIFCRAFSEV